MVYAIGSLPRILLYRCVGSHCLLYRCVMFYPAVCQSVLFLGLFYRLVLLIVPVEWLPIVQTAVLLQVSTVVRFCLKVRSLRH